MADNNGWGEHKYYILSTVEDNKRRLGAVEKELREILVELGKLNSQVATLVQLKQKELSTLTKPVDNSKIFRDIIIALISTITALGTAFFSGVFKS